MFAWGPHGDACPSSIIRRHQSHYPDGGGALRFPALPKKLPRNPGDLINLHFPPAGVCRIPVSLRSITSLYLWNETSCGKNLPAEWGWHVTACMHEQTGGFTSATSWTWAMSVKESFKPTSLAELQSWIQFKNTGTLCAQNRRETKPGRKLLVPANINSTCRLSAKVWPQHQYACSSQCFPPH